MIDGNGTPAVGPATAPEAAPRRVRFGLFLPLIVDESWSGTTRWTTMRELASTAEDIGIDTLLLPDHLIYRLPEQPNVRGSWEAISMAAALAASTRTVEIGHLVLSTSWRNPALLAKTADTIDEICGGRFILGLGAGWHEPEFRAYGFPFEHRFQRFAEAIHIIHGLLRNGWVDFEGRYFSARDCELHPRGPRAAGPPILFGTNGPRMLELLARYGDAWNSDWINSATNAAPVVAAATAALAAAGRDPATVAKSVSVQVDLPGAATRAPAGGPPLRGTPEQIADELRRYTALDIDQLQVWLNPNTPAGVERFAEVLALV